MPSSPEISTWGAMFSAYLEHRRWEMRNPEAVHAWEMEQIRKTLDKAEVEAWGENALFS